MGRPSKRCQNQTCCRRSLALKERYSAGASVRPPTVGLAVAMGWGMVAQPEPGQQALGAGRYATDGGLAGAPVGEVDGCTSVWPAAVWPM